MNTDIKGYKVFQPLLLGLAMALGIILGVKMTDKDHRSHWVQKIDNQTAPVGKIEEILRYIDHQYIDSIDQNHLIQVATTAILQELDPYCEYIEADGEYTLAKTLDGLKEGVGIKEVLYNEKFYVYNVFDNSSAANAGILKGDELISFNGKQLIDQRGICQKNRWFSDAKIGEDCEVKIVRNFGKDTLNFVLTKNYGSFIDPTPGFLINDNTAYIKVDKFSKGSYKRFMDHYEELFDRKEFKKLIIDLRDNTGGYVKEAINLLNQFFYKKEKLLLTTIDNSGKETKYKSTGRRFFPVEDVVVLINRHSASSSEIFAGVIQDWDIGTIIGQPSFGKGLVQEYFPLANGDKLKLSVARYQTPIGRMVFQDTTLKTDKVFHSKKLKRELFSGKIIPDVEVQTEGLEDMDLYGLLDEIMDKYVFYKLFTDSSFKELNIESLEFDTVYLKEIISKIEEYIELDRPFDSDELSEIKTIARANYLKHTQSLNAYQKYLNKRDSYIEKAMKQLDK